METKSIIWRLYIDRSSIRDTHDIGFKIRKSNIVIEDGAGDCRGGSECNITAAINVIEPCFICLQVSLPVGEVL